MADCPPDSELSDFLNESLAPNEHAVVSVHVDGCSACQRRLDRLTHDDDGPAARYKELSTFRAEAGTRFSTPPPGKGNIGDNTLPLPRFTGLPLVRGFEVLREVGRGETGVVYRALHQRLNRIVALKLVVADCAADERLVQDFLRELQILARTKHPLLVQVFELDTYMGPSGIAIPYVAMELLDGGSLARLLKQQPSWKLEPQTAAELIEGIARALYCMHLEGIIHRGLKPENILFPYLEPAERKSSANGKSKVPSTTIQSKQESSHFLVLPKVTDFGFANFKQDSTDSNTSSRHYSAPELVEGYGQIGPAADVYSLGAILFECLNGRPPGESSRQNEHLLEAVKEPQTRDGGQCTEFHRDLNAIVNRCLETDPASRYSSALELAEDLRRYLDKRPTSARSLALREQTWLWMQRNPSIAVVLATVASVLLAFTLVVMLG